MDERDAKKVFKRAKDDAIKFYDEEHLLDSDERKQLYVFFEQQFRRMMLLSSVGFAAGVAIPFFVRKKGKLMTPGLPIFGGIIGSSLMPALFNQTIFENQLNGIVDKYGTESHIYKTIKVVPEPVTKSFFWSNYFKRSSEDPTLRIRDPRDIDDANAPLVIHKPLTSDPDTGETISADIPQYGRPHITQRETAVSSWDRIRQEQSNSITTTATKADPSKDIYQRSLSIETDDPFVEETEETRIRSIGDSYDGDVKKSSWENIRKNNGV